MKDEEESGDSDRDEEEKWLDAVESGNVENHVDSELRSIQDPKLMTARQRALKANTSAGIDISGHPPLTDPPLTAVVDHISLDFTSAGRSGQIHKYFLFVLVKKRPLIFIVQRIQWANR